jgi:hypothetical protein
VVVMVPMYSTVFEAGVHLLTYLLFFFLMTADVFYAEAGARFIDSPCAFPHYNIS